jgi:hypothetical protein
MGKVNVRGLNRKPQRFKVDMTARFRVDGSSAWQEAFLQDLSTGGLKLQTTADLKTTQTLEFKIDTVDAKKQKQVRSVWGRVVWQKGTVFGIEFVKTPAFRHTA